jgi:fructose-1,6-bisphosphatase/inositol monophosphatase family enzyme
VRIEKQWLYLGREILCKIRQEIMDLECTILCDNERKTVEEIERLDRLAHAKADDVSENVLKDAGGTFIHIDHVHQNVVGDKSRSPEAIVAINAISGTRNFVRGIPYHCGSVAFATYSPNATIADVKVGSVMNYTTGDFYSSVESSPTHFNYRDIKTSSNTILDNAIIGIDLHTNDFAGMAPLVVKLIEKAEDARHMGSGTLEIYEVADGSVDGYVCLTQWDIAHLAPIPIIIRVQEGSSQTSQVNLFAHL